MESYKELIPQENFVDSLDSLQQSFFIDKSNYDDDIRDYFSGKLSKRSIMYMDVEKTISDLDTFFEMVPSTIEDIVLYRSVPDIKHANLDGFSSTTTNIDIATDYIYDNGYIMRIFVPKGSKVIPLYRIPIFNEKGESEVLIGRGYKCRVQNIYERYKKYSVIDCYMY